VLSGLLISDQRDPNKSVIFTASKGFVQRKDDGAFLLLRDGEIQQRDTESGNLTVIKYDSYVFDLSTFARKTELGDLRPKERTTPQLLNPDPDDPYYKSRPGLYRSQIHERFSEMLWPFAYVIVMLAFAGQARSSRQGYGSAIGAGMLVVTALRGFAFSAVSATKGDSTMVWLVYALPLIGIVIGSVFLVTNKPVALPRTAQERIDASNAAFKRRVLAIFERYLGWRRRLVGARA
ncbi:MAG: LptF/LptG family permease, partial [Novosphingobium sp.]|nr:LptF/LptG family permease [Novosphingobium sp.]